MPTYIHELRDWPNFTYDAVAIQTRLANVEQQRGMLIGRLQALGFDDLQNAKLQALTSEAVKSSEIEGEHLDYEGVRSSVARRLNIETGGVAAEDRRIEGVVAMTLDASENWEVSLTQERIFNWHGALFPTGRGPLGPVAVASWRDDKDGPMEVVSGEMTKNRRVHFVAPAANRLPQEMQTFLNWFETSDPLIPLIVKAGIAHLYFVTIHPFEDGNGRIGRAILDHALAKADQQSSRCYSLSAQIRKERSEYYAILEKTQKGNLDVTEWLTWYLDCLSRAIVTAHKIIESATARAKFWQTFQNVNFNERQKKVLNTMLSGAEERMTNRKWKQIARCSDATATRDLDELVRQSVIERSGQGRSVEYHLP